MINYDIVSHDVGYELFLPAMTMFAFGKKIEADSITEGEFRQFIEIAFRDSVIDFIEDTDLYRIEMPIDVYQDTKRYEVIPPEGFLVTRVIDLKTNKVKIPKHILSVDEIYLESCPDRDIEQAFYVVASVIPMRHHGVCKLDGRFLERYYSAILAKMKHTFSLMPVRNWRTLGGANLYKREYVKLKNRHIRDMNNQGGSIKLKTNRLSDV